MTKSKAAKIRSTAIVLAVGCVLVLLWQIGWLHGVLHLREYQLPYPTDILEAFFKNFREIAVNTRWTLTEAVLGILLGSVIGFAIALFATMSPHVGVGGLTVVTALNAIPMIAMATIMNNWFGMGMFSKLAVVAMFSMAGMALNAYRGMTELPPFAEDLMVSYAASPAVIFRELRLPHAVPYILTALKVSTTTGLMSAICSEFFTSCAGIGYRMTTVIKLSQMDLAWAYILVATLCGVVMYAIVSLVERVACKWHASQR